MKLKVTLEYDGRAFSGWQVQNQQRTVQGELEAALLVYVTSLAKRHGLPPPRPIAISGSGRTDSLVHARAQVASFRWPEEIPFDRGLFLHSLNGMTHRALSLLSVELVDDSFDARFTRHRKQYSYRLLLRSGSEALSEGRAWRIIAPVSIPEMCRAARFFAGKHDFANFRAADCVAATTVRTLQVSELSLESSDTLVYIVQGNGFLKQMVRTMVGTLVAVGKGELSADDIPKLLTGDARSPFSRTAPGRGLTLDWVRYP